MSKIFKDRPFHIGTARFNNDTYKENMKWKERKNWKGCCYGFDKNIAPHINTGDYIFRGDSLLLGADLTGKAFTKSVFGDFGQYIVAIGLLLFAFSTVATPFLITKSFITNNFEILTIVFLISIGLTILIFGLFTIIVENYKLRFICLS